MLNSFSVLLGCLDCHSFSQSALNALAPLSSMTQQAFQIEKKNCESHLMVPSILGPGSIHLLNVCPFFVIWGLALLLLSLF